MNTNGSSRFATYTLALSLPLLTSCGRAPAVEILGSFFPGWLVCLVAGIVLTAIGRLVLLRFHMNVDSSVIAYPSFTAFFTLALWLIFCH